MPKEIERKFLLNSLPKESDFKWQTEEVIQQGYLQIDAHKDLRIRCKGEKYTLTAKHGTGMVREEREQTISADLFATLWPFTATMRLTKTRFTATTLDGECVVDVYDGDLTGLIVMEVEFASETAANTFSMPNFCVREITDDHRFRNANLALKGMPYLPN